MGPAEGGQRRTDMARVKGLMWVLGQVLTTSPEGRRANPNLPGHRLKPLRQAGPNPNRSPSSNHTQFITNARPKDQPRRTSRSGLEWRGASPPVWP